VHGAKGRILAGNHTASTVELADADAVKSEKPLHFFLERYEAAYRRELDAFVAAIRDKRPMPVGAADGRQALVLAEAAVRSLVERRPVQVAEISGVAS
jgi:myo-inositol 2-dehydrogenase/D-chiro-inositol 1-dehydrogenase